MSKKTPKVAAILDEKRLVLSAGRVDGIREGKVYKIVPAEGVAIEDPDTGENLGGVDVEKTYVKIISVKEKLSVASTFRSFQKNIGGSGSGSFAALTEISRAMNPPKYVMRTETLKLDENAKFVPLDVEESYVKIGDIAILLSEDEMAILESGN